MIINKNNNDNEIEIEIPGYVKEHIDRTLDRLVLYEVFQKQNQDNNHYTLHPRFIDFIQTIFKLAEGIPENHAMMHEMSNFEFIRTILLPSYFTISKIMKDYLLKVDGMALSTK